MKNISFTERIFDSQLYIRFCRRKNYKGKHGLEPIVNRDECIKIVEKSLTKDNIRDYCIFNKKKPSSPNFIEFVRMVWDYDNSPYIKGRLKEGKCVCIPDWSSIVQRSLGITSFSFFKLKPLTH